MADIGVVGLAVMGQNLVLNLNDHGFTVCVYNRTISKVDEFLAKEAAGTRVKGAHSIEELVKSLKRPRKVLLMVKAGSAVDDFLAALLPYLESGDIVIDGGNSLYLDTERRVRETMEKAGVHFVGCGVSGGEEGARHGPSLMPGGSSDAWPHIRQMFQAIAARTPDGSTPCCEWVGEGGAGHFVKMVHNGIEYGDMQLIGEAYHLMRDGLGLSHADMSRVFREWNKGPLDSFLIQITADILAVTNEKDGNDKNGKNEGGKTPLVMRIRDAAGQKGTGKWTVEAALQLGQPLTLVSEAVFARALSALKDDRSRASQILTGPQARFAGRVPEMVEHLQQALYAAKIISYAQGFMLFQEAARHFGWMLNLSGIATMWMGGCIIRSTFLADINRAFSRQSNLSNLLFDDFFRAALAKAQNSWRLVLAEAIMLGIPCPALSTALAFYDGYRCDRLPANLLQAQRDYFGAHTFEWIDQPGTWHHYNWTGQGGTTSASTYNA